jgi:preprotein translocase subunit SecE
MSRRGTFGARPGRAGAALEIPPGSAYLPHLSQPAEPIMATKTNPFQFLQQVRGEVAKVVWPTRREVVLTTIMVFIMAALTATFFSLVDLAIRSGLSFILNVFH